MSDAQLWLTTIQAAARLSVEEKYELFVNDFKNENDNAKPKAIEKTLNVIEKKYNIGIQKCKIL